VTAVAALPSVDTLVSGLVDYAGLFPPADLDMATTARNYAAYRMDGQSRLLGRLVVPASRLEEFGMAAESLLPRRRTDEPWRLSALAGPEVGADVERIIAFNQAYVSGKSGRAVVDSMEARAETVEEVARVAAATPPTLELFVELPLSPDPAPLIAELARRGVRAKVRTGGVTPDAIPSTSDVGHFVVQTTRAGVPFKATAGLHHPVRGMRPLTYAPDSPRAIMHGFLNVFLAAAFAGAGFSEPNTVAVLEETDAQAFRFGPGGVRWRDQALTVGQLRTTRTQIARAFGSCSFREPVDDLRSLHLL
jgi:hypothetical protein